MVGHEVRSLWSATPAERKSWRLIGENTPSSFYWSGNCVCGGRIPVSIPRMARASGICNSLDRSPQQSNYWRYAIPVATATMLLWPLRILSRMLLSNLHLREDARERVTMANTYLALVQSKEGLKDEDRKLILEMLFRPASLGIVRDDAATPSITHFLSRLGSGQRHPFLLQLAI